MAEFKDMPIKLEIPELETAKVVVSEGGLAVMSLSKENYFKICLEMVQMMTFEMMEECFRILKRNGVKIVFEGEK